MIRKHQRMTVENVENMTRRLSGGDLWNSSLPSFRRPLVRILVVVVWCLLSGSTCHGQMDAPVHIQMCRSIEALKHCCGENANVWNERVEVCQGRDHPTSGWMHVLASTFLSEVARSHGINVWYHHECGRTVNRLSAVQASTTQHPFRTTLLQILPSPLIVPDGAITVTNEGSNVSLEYLLDLCGRCTRDYENSVSSSPSCILFDGRHMGSEPNQGGTFSEKRTDESFFAFYNEEDLHFDGSQIEEGYRMAIQGIMRSGMIERNVEYALDHVATQGVLNAHEHAVLQIYRSQQQSRALVYVGENFEFDHIRLEAEAPMPPDEFFPLGGVPDHIQSIEVMAPAYCTCGDPCMERAKNLSSRLRGMYPQVPVIFNDELPAASFLAHAKMMETEHLACLGAVESCLLPALARRRVRGRSDGRKRTTIVSVREDRVKSMPPILSALLPSTNSETFRVLATDTIADSLVDTGLCREVRGRYGRWVSNVERAARYQYDRGILHHPSGRADLSFQATDDQPYRPATTYEWHPMDFIFPQCSIHERLFDLQSFCRTIAGDLGVRRVLMVGDSTQQAQAWSAWKLMGFNDDPEDNGEGTFTREIVCPGNDPGNADGNLRKGNRGEQAPKTTVVEFTYIRNDQMIENKKPVDVRAGVDNCSAYCLPWTERYRDYDDGRTLLLIGFGAHFSEPTTFRDALDDLLRSLDGMPRRTDDQGRADIVLFRTAVPGHAGCDVDISSSSPEGTDAAVTNVDGGPFRNIFLYLPTRTNDFAWDQFHEYDRSLKEALANLPGHRSSSSSLVNHMDVLDVYPMTVLRRDGHIGGEECVADACTAPTRDCLHYNLPGPPDWWNHLMLNNLADLSTDENPTKQSSTSPYGLFRFEE